MFLHEDLSSLDMYCLLRCSLWMFSDKHSCDLVSINQSWVGYLQFLSSQIFLDHWFLWDQGSKRNCIAKPAHSDMNNLDIHCLEHPPKGPVCRLEAGIRQEVDGVSPSGKRQRLRLQQPQQEGFRNTWPFWEGTGEPKVLILSMLSVG